MTTPKSDADARIAELEQKIRILRAKLEHYANEANWYDDENYKMKRHFRLSDELLIDGFDIAQRALAEIKEPNL